MWLPPVRSDIARCDATLPFFFVFFPRCWAFFIASPITSDSSACNGKKWLREKISESALTRPSEIKMRYAIFRFWPSVSNSCLIWTTQGGDLFNAEQTECVRGAGKLLHDLIWCFVHLWNTTENQAKEAPQYEYLSHSNMMVKQVVLNWRWGCFQGCMHQECFELLNVWKY